MKLPVLFAHYHEHQLRNTNISVMEFLCMHYWGQDANDDDNDRDMQLPYKTVNIHTVTHSFIPLEKVASFYVQDVPLTQTVYPLLTNNDTPDPALASLFRPPQV